ncbi:MAG: hypothetical protein ACRERC_07175 [Candidatus Binatia bacterium]
MHCTSRPEIQPMHRAAPRLCWLALACAFLFGCGGSGSSGFELQLREDRAIDEALDANGCEVNEGLTICAAGGQPSPITTPTGSILQTATPTPTLPEPQTTTPTPTGQGSDTPTPPVDTTMTPTPTLRQATDTPTPTVVPAAPQVDTNLSPGDAANCIITAPGGPCLFEFSFAPVGFDDRVSYRVAVRAIDASGSGAWSILEPPVDNGASYTVFMVLDPAAQQQTAVLVFEQPPGMLPDSVQRLAETGADYAFVSASFGVTAEEF